MKRVNLDPGGETNWQRGRFAVVVKPDRNELGTIAISGDLMKRRTQ